MALAAKVEGAKTALIERLIGEAKALPNVSERIDLISRKLLGIRYQANTLIGSPKQPEKFVVRDDAFDCVTFCEVVLAAAISRDMAEFETSLRRIRYDHGNVQYDQRNHYFADWCKRNIENGICRPVAIEPSITIDKTLTWHREFGKHPVSMVAITKETLLANAKLLAPGDIIGFTSRRAGLDYYHTGLVAFGKTGELLMRNASLSRGRVVEDKMAAFVSRQSGEICDLVAPGRKPAGGGAPLKKRKARAPRRRPARSRPKRPTVAELIRSTARRLKRAKLVFAHGTSDPVAEAAFLVGETLGIHPDHIDARAGMAVTAAQEKKIAALAERRIRTRKPAAYLLKRIYMRGVPFYYRRARHRAAFLSRRNSRQ